MTSGKNREGIGRQPDDMRPGFRAHYTRLWLAALFVVGVSGRKGFQLAEFDRLLAMIAARIPVDGPSALLVRDDLRVVPQKLAHE